MRALARATGQALSFGDTDAGGASATCFEAETICGDYSTAVARETPPQATHSARCWPLAAGASLVAAAPPRYPHAPNARQTSGLAAPRARLPHLAGRRVGDLPRRPAARPHRLQHRPLGAAPPAGQV